MTVRPWTRLPSRWITSGTLAQLKWAPGGEGSDNTAALMVLTAIAHVADDDSGIARATYDQLCNATGLSRAKLSKALDRLYALRIITTVPFDPRSTYRLVDYDPYEGWSKFPAKSMYSGGRIGAFDHFGLRKPIELDALKLFFLFIARRDRKTNMANIGYEKIEENTGINRAKIKPAISFLASLSLVYVEQVPSKINPLAYSNAYRIVGVEPYVHMGTRGRGSDQLELVSRT